MPRTPVSDPGGVPQLTGSGAQLVVGATAFPGMILPVIDDLFEHAPVGLGVFDAEARWIRANASLAALTGMTPGDLLGRTPVDLYGEPGQEAVDTIARVRASGGVESNTMSGDLGEGMRTFDLLWFALPEGVGIAAVDITARRDAEEALADAHRRDALMARAGHLLSTALSVQQSADLLARLVVPEIADWCFVELVQPDGSIERTAMAHRDPAKEQWAREISERYPLDPDSPVGSPQVIRTGEPQLLEEIPDEMLVAAAIDDEHLRLLRALGFRSACLVPLVARGRVIGDLALAMGPESGRTVGPDTLAVARALAERAAVALDNATLYAQRDLVAVSLQEELLPRELPAVPGIDIAARYSAAGEGNDVGGDFYDVFALDADRWLVVIGDVVGKGPAAAAVTGLARHTLRAIAPYEQRPCELLRELNRAMVAEQPGRRMGTVACVRIEPATAELRLAVSAAGHPLPLLVGADGGVREVGDYGPMLGADAVLDVHDTHDVLRPGELLVLHTDGVVDARGPDGLFGEQRLHDLLREVAGEAPARVVQHIEGAVLAHSVGRPRDDVAVVALRPRSS